jgi:hypothetical protein
MCIPEIYTQLQAEILCYQEVCRPLLLLLERGGGGGLRGCEGCLFWLQRQFRLIFPGGDGFDKRDNFEYRTSHVVLDVSLKREPRLYVNLAAVC